ncbi:hypothetical protein niasHT_020198 [Heterodera trifolii]|uniref:Uncharacterized protein n=1 Tax=Heterodera trifolii TaxID=157864 RepID=A0ABD2K4B0_9BILA
MFEQFRKKVSKICNQSNKSDAQNANTLMLQFEFGTTELRQIIKKLMVNCQYILVELKRKEAEIGTLVPNGGNGKRTQIFFEIGIFVKNFSKQFFQELSDENDQLSELMAAKTLLKPSDVFALTLDELAHFSNAYGNNGRKFAQKMLKNAKIENPKNNFFPSSRRIRRNGADPIPFLLLLFTYSVTFCYISVSDETVLFAIVTWFFLFACLLSFYRQN